MEPLLRCHQLGQPRQSLQLWTAACPVSLEKSISLTSGQHQVLKQVWSQRLLHWYCTSAWSQHLGAQSQPLMAGSQPIVLTEPQHGANFRQPLHRLPLAHIL